MTARRFAGWQIQADSLTVQGVLTAAIEALVGRGDAGARAPDAPMPASMRAAQVAHVDLTKEWDTDTVRDALNAHLRPHPIADSRGRAVADDFNARISAVKAPLSLSHHQPPRRS